MATNKVHAARRLNNRVAAVAHRAGDLVYHEGHYGIVQDDVAAGAKFTLLLEDAWNLPRVPSTLADGVVVSAPATEIATSLPIGARAATTGTPGTTGWFPIGRTIATGTATTAKIQLFNPNSAY